MVYIAVLAHFIYLGMNLFPLCLLYFYFVLDFVHICFRKEANGKTYIKFEVIGSNNVAVPTHFFKVLVVEKTNGELEMEAYVMPNQVIDNNVPLSSFQVRFSFLPNIKVLYFAFRFPQKV